MTLHALRTLWINTGTLCNIACAGCYIESSPANDRLAYLTRAEVAAALAEAMHTIRSWRRSASPAAIRS